MKIEFTERLRRILIGFAALVIIIGISLNIFQNHYGNFIIMLGFILRIILDGIEIHGLKKIIKKYEEKR